MPVSWPSAHRACSAAARRWWASRVEGDDRGAETSSSDHRADAVGRQRAFDHELISGNATNIISATSICSGEQPREVPPMMVSHNDRNTRDTKRH